MRKKTQAFTAREKPNARLMYNSTEVLGAFGTVVPPLAVAAFATCVAEKAKNKNRNVPTNSPIMAINRLRTRLGSHPNPASRLSPGWLESVVGFLMPGKTMKLLAGLSTFILAIGESR